MRQARAPFLLLLFALLVAPGLERATLAREPLRVETVPFQSAMTGRMLTYNVVLPPDYEKSRARTTRYPVLYLLHGLGGSAADWVSTKTHLADYAAFYRMLIIVPEGKEGWYTDSATVAADKFESYFVQELMPDVQRRFRTIEAREGRSVAGLSMGGYGALKFGLKYPEMFVFAASMSGALGAPSWKPEDPLPAFVKPSVVRVFGAADSPTRAANDLFQLTRALTPERTRALPFFYLDCGTEDFLIDSNRALAALFLERKIPHEYRQLPGEHSWPYWDRQVQEILQIATRRMTAAQDSKHPAQVKDTKDTKPDKGATSKPEAEKKPDAGKQPKAEKPMAGKLPVGEKKPQAFRPSSLRGRKLCGLFAPRSSSPAVALRAGL